MKVLAFNGSPRIDGNTHNLIKIVSDVLNKNGIETEEINIGHKPVKPCQGCLKCQENKDGLCIIKDDELNNYLAKMKAADGFILGSPVYTADVTGQMKSFIDRVSLVSYVNDFMFEKKVGAALVSVGRGGALPAYNTINAFYGSSKMYTVGSSYWNFAIGRDKGEVLNDGFGIETIKDLGENMTWLLNKIHRD